MCQSVAQPSTALYWHMGETTTRLGSSIPARRMGKNRALVMREAFLHLPLTSQPPSGSARAEAVDNRFSGFDDGLCPQLRVRFGPPLLHLGLVDVKGGLVVLGHEVAADPCVARFHPDRVVGH